VARRRRAAEPEHEPEALDAVELEPRDFLDARAFIDERIPAAVRATPANLLRWAELHAPNYVLTEEDARAHREHLARARSWQEARRAARRARAPAPADYVPGFEGVAS
jgi:hypothetical protein